LDRYIPIEDMTLQAVEVEEVKYVPIDEIQHFVETKVTWLVLSIREMNCY
jgi:hypothetical protein